MEQSLGRNSIVGTTIRNPDDIPQHLGADEKHTRILGDKVYVATTVGNECILGASIAKDAGEESLKDAYQVFKDEAQCLKPDYTPTTVNMDGWKATRNAWKFLFSSLRSSSSAVFYMSSLKFAIEPKRSTKTSLMRPHPSFGTVIMLKRKIHSLSESEDLSSGARIITCHLLLQIPLKNYVRIFPHIKSHMISLKHIGPAI